VQVAPITPTSKPPGRALETNMEKLKYGETSFKFGFNFNLRRYIEGMLRECGFEAGAYIRPLFNLT